MKSRELLSLAVVMLCTGGLVVLAVGCPLLVPVDRTKVTTVLSYDASGAKADVPLTDIESLLVTVTEVTLVPADGDEGQGGGDKAGGHVTVYQGSMDVELKNLVGVSEVLSSTEIPAGVYNQIRLSIENPRMTLVDSSKAVYTNIHLTANSRLFITEKFELPGGEVILQLDFAGVKIVEQGNGDYTWTPQLEAELTIVAIETTSEGTVASLDLGNNQFTLQESGVVVDFSGAVIYRDDSSVGDATDLADGQTVQVHGLLYSSGVLMADEVYILPPPPTP
jgi:hypothetical protein